MMQTQRAKVLPGVLWTGHKYYDTPNTEVSPIAYPQYTDHLPFPPSSIHAIYTVSLPPSTPSMRPHQRTTSQSIARSTVDSPQYYSKIQSP